MCVPLHFTNVSLILFFSAALLYRTFPYISHFPNSQPKLCYPTFLAQIATVRI